METIQQNIRFVKQPVSNMEPVTARLAIIGSIKEPIIAKRPIVGSSMELQRVSGANWVGRVLLQRLPKAPPTDACATGDCAADRRTI